MFGAALSLVSDSELVRRFSMEAASISQPQDPPGKRVADFISENILWILLGGALLALFIGNPTKTANNVVDGLSAGTIWALIALGYTLVYGIIELINFAHGEVFMIGGFVAVSMFGTLGLTEDTGTAAVIGGMIVVLAISMVAAGSLNVMIERVAYRQLRNAPKLTPLITAIGMSFILQNVGLLWRPSPDSPPNLIRSQQEVFSIADVAFLRSDIFAVIVTVPLLMTLLWFVGSTKYGKAMRATAQDPDAARLMGINVDRTISLTFLLGGLLAGAAGLIYALYNLTVRFNMGFTAGLIAFTAAVMGGIGNLKGAVVGGLIIGIVQQTAESRLQDGSAWAPAVVFAILIMIMVFRPGGLFGEEIREG
jgi:branched-chain amino acid transport system permease protein